MIEILALETLLTTGRAADYPVAYRYGRLIDFAEFESSTTKWREAFATQSGERWALYFDDSYEFATALFGAWHAGKFVVLPSDTLPATVARLRNDVAGFAGDWPSELMCLQTASQAGGNHGWQALNPDAVQLVLFTSGSTGEPSAIPKKLSQLFLEVAMLAHHWGSELADVTFQATVTHQHMYGLPYRVLLPLALGRPFESRHLIFPEDIARAMAMGPTALVTSPAHLGRLPENLPWVKARENLRLFFSAGGPLSDEALAACRKLLGQVPVEIYGSSETGCVAWRKRDEDDLQPWQFLPGMEGRIEGEVLKLRSRQLPDDDWHVTSDRVLEVSKGFQLLGRVDRIIKIEEKRVSLSAIERSLMESGLVEDVRVTPITDGGERLVLGVVAVPNTEGWKLLDEHGKRALNEALRRYAAHVVEASALPRRWRYVWTLPVNNIGKTTEAALLAQFDPRRPEVRLLERNESHAHLQLNISVSSPYFEGHFPGSPVLPGIAQIDCVIALGRDLFPLPPRFLRLESVKFQQVIRPGVQLGLKLDFQAERGTLRFIISSASGDHSSGRVVFGAAQ